MLAVALFTTTARAEQSADSERPPGATLGQMRPVRPPAPPQPPPPPQPSYRLYAAAADGLAVAMLATSLLRSNDRVQHDLMYGALATYAFGAPAVHIAHDHWGRALCSLGLRVGLPVLGGMIFSDGGEHGDDGVYKGLWLGAIAAVVIDTAALAGEAEVAPGSRPRSSSDVFLTAGATASSLSLGIAGGF